MVDDRHWRGWLDQPNMRRPLLILACGLAGTAIGLLWSALRVPGVVILVLMVVGLGFVLRELRWLKHVQAELDQAQADLDRQMRRRTGEGD